MYSNYIVGGIFILIFLVTIFFFRRNRYKIIELYSGSYGEQRMRMFRYIRNPRTLFENNKGESLIVKDIKDPKYILFRTESDEILLVNQEEKSIPKVGDKIIVRNSETGNFYIRKVKYVYDGYDEIDDYKFLLENESADPEKEDVVSWTQIIGNLNYKAIK